MRLCSFHLVLFLSVVVMTAHADEGDPILHEFFSGQGDLPRPGDEAAAAEQVYGRTGPDDPLNLGPDGPGARNGPAPNEQDTTLDRDTDLEGWLNYFAVFEPTVAPFKRVGSRDAVLFERGEPRLGISDETARRVRLDFGGPEPTSDVFRATISVHLEEGALIPIPSVAPNMDIHDYTVQPPLTLRFSRDGAGNYFVQGDHDGVATLEYLVSAPNSYFGGPLPTNSLLSDIPVRRRPNTPEAIAPVAQELFELLGLSPSMPLAEIVSETAAYFRSFQALASPLEGRTEDIYRDIAFGGLGVCRHRSFAFVVTMQAWGVPARYLYNEAHAFTEIWFPGVGWRRIDLGGGAEGLNVLNASSSVLHSPPSGDPIPTPSSYSESYSAQVGQESGTAEYAESNPDGPWEEGAGTRLWDLPPPAPRNAREREHTPDGRDPSRIFLNSADAEAFRGEPMTVRGQLTDFNGVGLSDRPVRIYLGPPDHRSRGRVVPLDLLVTDDAGLVDGEVSLPQSLPVGNWSVYLVFEGDAEYAATRSR